MSYNLGEARGKIVIETDFGSLKEGQKALDGYKKSAQDTGTSSQEAWRKTGTAATVAGVAVAAGFGLAIKTASDFEFRMSAIQAVSGATAGEMDLISEAALRIGKDTVFSASDAALAMEELIKAGISTKDVLNGAADATVALAAAGGVDLPTAATIAANAMNQFNKTADELVGVTDTIAGAANASAIDMGEFAMSLGQVGAVANLAGLSFEDTSLAIAAMGNAGIKGSDAGTSLKQVLLNLIPSTKKQADLFRELGITTLDSQAAFDMLSENGITPASQSFGDIFDAADKYIQQQKGLTESTDATQKAATKLLTSNELMKNSFYDSEGQLKSLAEVSDVLSTALEGMTDAQKQATLEQMFGSDAIRGAAIIAKEGSAGFDELSASINKVSAADVAATRMDNLQGSTEQLMGSLETLWITVGTKLIPVFRQIVDSLTAVVNWFGSLSGTSQNVIVAAIGIAGALALVLGLSIKTAQGIMSMIDVYKALNLAMLASKVQTIASGVAYAAIRGYMLAWQAATAIATAAQWALNVALTANPIGLVIAAIVALVAGLIWFFTQTELGQAIWQGFVDFLVGAWQWLAAAAKVVWDAVMVAINAVVQWFQTYVMPIIQFVIDAIIAYFTLWYTIISTVMTAIMTAIAAVVDWFATYVGPLIDAAIKLWVRIFQFLGSAIAAVWNTIVSFITTVVKAIVDFVVKYFTIWLNTMKTILNAIWTAVSTVWNNIVNFIKPIVKGIVDFVTSTWNGLIAIVRTIFTAVYNVVKPIFDNVYNFIKGIVMNVVNYIRSTWATISGTVATIFNNVYNAIKGPIQNALNFIMGFKDTVIGFFAGAGQWLMDAGANIIGGLIEGIQNALGGLTDLLGNITNLIPESKGPPKRDKVLLEENGRLIMQSLINGMSSKVAAMKGMLGDVTTSIPLSVSQESNAATSTLVPARSDGKPGTTVNLTVNWYAAPGGSDDTKSEVMQMLGNASDLVRKEL